MRIDLRLQIFYLSLCSKKLFFIDFRDQIFDLPGHLIKPCADLIKLSCIKFPHLRIQSAVSKFPDIFSDKLQRTCHSHGYRKYDNRRDSDHDQKNHCKRLYGGTDRGIDQILGKCHPQFNPKPGFPSIKESHLISDLFLTASQILNFQHLFCLFFSLFICKQNLSFFSCDQPAAFRIFFCFGKQRIHRTFSKGNNAAAGLLHLLIVYTHTYIRAFIMCHIPVFIAAFQKTGIDFFINLILKLHIFHCLRVETTAHPFSVFIKQIDAVDKRRGGINHIHFRKQIGTVCKLLPCFLLIVRFSRDKMFQHIIMPQRNHHIFHIFDSCIKLPACILEIKFQVRTSLSRKMKNGQHHLCDSKNQCRNNTGRQSQKDQLCTKAWFFLSFLHKPPHCCARKYSIPNKISRSTCVFNSSRDANLLSGLSNAQNSISTYFPYASPL